MKIFLVVSTVLFSVYADFSPCVQRNTEAGSICVCNSTYCDNVPELVELNPGEYQFYTSSVAKLGFWSTTGKFGNNRKANSAVVSVDIDVNKTYQTIDGFGGAFTDSAGINILTLSEKAQDLLLRSYFADDGIRYVFGRVPIGAADFSIRGYTLCDEEDETLEKFALQEEDLKFKIPIIRKAAELLGDEQLKLFGSAWTAPKWMKTNNAYTGTGTVKPEYYDAWARYYVKVFDEYQKNGVDFWGVTVQNEPVITIRGSELPNNGFDYDQMTVWVSEYMGPIIKGSNHSDVKILLHDDNRRHLPGLKEMLLSNPDVVKYADGIAVHWYTDSTTPAKYLREAKSPLKDLFTIATEACIGFQHDAVGNSVSLGNWTRGVQYIDDIIEDLEFDVVAWVEWNLALNGTGQPNWVKWSADAPIIVNPETDEFYKQPMFYALGHFSRFVVPKSVRVDAQFEAEGLGVLSVLRPDNKVAVVLSNSLNQSIEVNVNIKGDSTTFTLEAFSINTVLYAL